MRRAAQRGVGVAVVLAVVGAAVWFGGFDPEGSVTDAGEAQASDGEPSAGPTRVELTTAARGDLETHIDATANLVAEHQVSVVAEAAGRITRLGPDVGESVEAGALLVALDPADATRLRRTAEIRLRAAQAAAKRTDQLAAQALVATEEQEKAITDRALAKQELADAQAALRHTRVRAPMAGRVTRRDVERGQYVKVGDPLFEVIDFSVLVARIHVPERDAMLLEPGREVELTLQAKSDVKFEGSVRRIASVVDLASGTVEVTIEVKNAPAVVRSGSFVGVHMIREQHLDVCLLPRDAVVVDHQGSHVFVVEDGIATRRAVTLGPTERGRVHVVDGLECSESVVLAGHGALQDGAAVAVADAESEAD